MLYLADAIMRGAIDNYVSNLNQRDSYQLRSIGNTNDLFDIAKNMSEEAIEDKFKTNKRVREMLLDLKTTISKWDYSEKLVEVEERLEDKGIELECNYDFKVNKWNIKRYIGFNKDKEFNIWFSTFDRMRDYMLSEMMW